MKTTEQSIEKLAFAFVDLCPKMDSEAQRVSIQIYQHLALGKPVAPQKIASSLNIQVDKVQTVLDQWDGVFFNDLGEIVGYWGLALPEMDHRFEVGAQVLYTWCAWDALFIPELIEQTARVVSVCPVSQQVIRLTVTPNGVTRLDPENAVMSFVSLDADAFSENVIQNFCHHVHFFASAEVGTQWMLEQKNTRLLSVHEAFTLGKLKNKFQYINV